MRDPTKKIPTLKQSTPRSLHGLFRKHGFHPGKASMFTEALAVHDGKQLLKPCTAGLIEFPLL